jgi:predicted thioesterase
MLALVHLPEDCATVGFEVHVKHVGPPCRTPSARSA